MLFWGAYVKTPRMVGGWNEVCHWFYKVGPSSRTDELINQLLNTPRRCYRKCLHLGSFILPSSCLNFELSAELQHTSAIVLPFHFHMKFLTLIQVTFLNEKLFIAVNWYCSGFRPGKSCQGCFTNLILSVKKNQNIYYYVIIHLSSVFIMQVT